MQRLKEDNERLKNTAETTQSYNEELVETKRQLLEQIDGLKEDLAFYSRNAEAKESIKRIDVLRVEKEEQEK